MTLSPRRLVLLSGLVPTLLTAAVALYRPAFVTSLDYGAYDTIVRAASTRPPDNRILIVDVDERSLSAVGQWTWRRDVVARLIGRLRELGASTIALDILFAESDRYGSGSGLSGDQVLAETLSGGGVALGYALTFGGSPDQATACVQHPLGIAVIRRDDDRGDEPFFRATGAVCSLPALTHAAGSSGFLNAAPDPDGRLRRVPLLLALNGGVHPALALAAVVSATRIHDIDLRVLNANTTSLLLDRRTVPLDGKSNLLVRYRGPKHTFPYISAVDVLSGQARPDMFKDRIVFVGTTALGTREVVATPLDTLFAGVEVHATVADNLLQQDFIHRPEYAAIVETQVVLSLGIAVALLVARAGLGWGGIGVAACLAALWAGAVGLISTSGTFLSPVAPSIGLLAAFGTMAVAQLTLERRRADQAGHDRETSQHLMIQGLLSLTEVRDAETGRHSRRTQAYARVIAEQLATQPDYRQYLTPQRIDLLSRLAPLHDIGKVGVPDSLLNKRGALTIEETMEMRKHPGHGLDVIERAERDVGVPDDINLAMAKEIVYTHHEKWDGTGYPQGLRGTQIPIVGRLMALVDVYDAITTRRVYRDPMSHADAVAFICAGRGTHFDPAVVDAFLRVAGTLERLSHEGEWNVPAARDGAALERSRSLPT
jgi:HD-GYP domain-containing protein (c-di-GMP phosphodiesterase class II)